MTSKFKQIIDQLNAIAVFKADKSMSDEDFIANIDAINLLCNLYDDLGLDRSGIRRKMSNLYPEFPRRIYGKKDIQLAIPLIKALHRYIYDRSDDRGPEKWRNSFVEMCCKVVDSYRKCPLIDATEYLFALDTVCRVNEYSGNNDIDEYKDDIAALLEDIDNVPLSEKIRRVRTYQRSKHLFASDNWEKWDEVRESLKEADLSQLDDATFILWREITEIAPMKELKRRSGHSKKMQVEYLHGLIFTEFVKQRRLEANRKLTKDLRILKDDIIGDIIPLKIDAEMSVSTLYALETIFFLRLQLAQVGWDEKEPVYESLCRNRFEQIAKALTKKYRTAVTINEKIEILEQLTAICMLIQSSDLVFAIEEADKLKDTPTLTYAQKLRLDWIPTINSEKESQIIVDLLPQTQSVFEMATFAQITSFCTKEERQTIFTRYFELYEVALLSNNEEELAKLLTLAAYWNINPAMRPLLDRAANRASSVKGLSLPVKRVNSIAAEIYSRIDKITGKYEEIDNLSA